MAGWESEKKELERKDELSEEELGRLREENDRLRRQVEGHQDPAKPSFGKKAASVGGTAVNWSARKSLDHTSSTPFIIMALVALGVEWFWPYPGIDVFETWALIGATGGINFLTGIFNAIVVLILIIYVVYFYLQGNKETNTLVSFAIMIGLFSFIFQSGGSSIGFWVHFLFAIYLSFGLIKRIAPTEAAAYGIISAYLILDFLLFSVLRELFPGEIVSNQLFIPIPLLFTIIYSMQLQKNGAAKVAMTAAMIFYVIGMVSFGYLDADLSAKAVDGQQEQLIDYFVDLWGGVQREVNNTATSLSNTNDDLVRRAVGDQYFRGQVDPQAKIELGVTLEEARYNERQFEAIGKIPYEWKIEAATLTEDILIDPITCTLEGPQETTYIGSATPRELLLSSQVNDILSCQWDGATLTTEGAHSVLVQANFNFATQAYLASYIIDDGVLRQMRRDDIDPLRNFGITDKDPKTIHTVGPVEIGMNMRTSPVGVSEELVGDLPFGFTIAAKWKGAIQEIDETLLFLPKGFVLKPDGEDSNTFCGGYVLEESTCSNQIIMSREGEEWCADEVNQIYVFNQEGENRKLIANDVQGKQRVTVTCRMEVADLDELMQDQTFATVFFKIITLYDYALEERTSISISGVPEDVATGALDYTNTNCNCAEAGSAMPSETMIGRFNGVKTIVEQQALTWDACSADIAAIMQTASGIQEENIAGCEEVRSTTNVQGQIECAARAVQRGMLLGSYENWAFNDCAKDENLRKCVYDTYFTEYGQESGERTGVYGSQAEEAFEHYPSWLALVCNDET